MRIARRSRRSIGGKKHGNEHKSIDRELFASAHIIVRGFEQFVANGGQFDDFKPAFPIDVQWNCIEWESKDKKSHLFNWTLTLLNFFIHLPQKLQNSELSEVVLKELRRRYNGRSSMNQTEVETAQQSMELMRQNVQHLFDNEIQAIVQKYIEVGELVFHLQWLLWNANRFELHYRHTLSQLWRILKRIWKTQELQTNTWDQFR